MARIERSRARQCPEMELAFLTDDVEKLTELRTAYQSHWRAAREFLAFFDTIRFCRYRALLDGRNVIKIQDQK